VVSKIAVTLDRRTVSDLDRWVREGKYPNRSRALQSDVDLLSEREKRTRLVRELAKLDPKQEKRLAEEGSGDNACPNTERRNVGWVAPGVTISIDRLGKKIGPIDAEDLSRIVDGLLKLIG
jgi:Arc/MetJ-type ribon-helix-helix transcriptional regulator